MLLRCCFRSLFLFLILLNGGAHAGNTPSRCGHFKIIVNRHANDTTPPYLTDSADVSTMDALIKATYSVISGAAGPRNWNRFHSLFLPEARMGASIKTHAGKIVFRTFTPQEYQKNNAPFFMKGAFYEEELGRTASLFGNIAQVQSAYQYRLTAGGKIEQRGINYFTLVKSEGRWWIAGLLWQDEDGENPLPQEMLRK